MEHIGKILRSKQDIVNNVNNDTNTNNDNSVIRKKKYALNRSKFTPNTEQSQLAERIALAFNDVQNYACYLSVINRVGCPTAERLFLSTQSDITEKAATKYPVRNKAKYFMWKLKYHKY